MLLSDEDELQKLEMHALDFILVTTECGDGE